MQARERHHGQPHPPQQRFPLALGVHDGCDGRVSEAVGPRTGLGSGGTGLELYGLTSRRWTTLINLLNWDQPFLGVAARPTKRSDSLSAAARRAHGREPGLPGLLLLLRSGSLSLGDVTHYCTGHYWRF